MEGKLRSWARGTLTLRCPLDMRAEELSGQLKTHACGSGVRGGILSRGLSEMLLQHQEAWPFLRRSRHVCLWLHLPSNNLLLRPPRRHKARADWCCPMRGFQMFPEGSWHRWEEGASAGAGPSAALCLRSRDTGFSTRPRAPQRGKEVLGQ